MALSRGGGGDEERARRAALQSAWTLFARYDQASAQYRRERDRLQMWILSLGILATFLALLQDSGVGGAVLHWSVVALPITAATLVTLGERSAGGKKWPLLRAAAESVKSEIYRFRTRTGLYAEGWPPATLESHLTSLDEDIMKTASDVVVPFYRGELPPTYGAAPDDDGFADLASDDYLRLRVDDAILFFRLKVLQLGRLRGLATLVMVGAGGVGTVLAVANREAWVGLTTVLAGTAVAFVAYNQIESRIVGHNQSASRLESLRRRWEVRSDGGYEAFGALVDTVESILAADLARRFAAGERRAQG
jgi:Protein of unknown function (DUF4231)/SMODS and SLOG-associating 2TM effector domain 1